MISEIKTTYQSLAKVYHLDLSSNDQDFIEIHNAYETLSDPTARAVYDMSLVSRRRTRTTLFGCLGRCPGFSRPINGKLTSVGRNFQFRVQHSCLGFISFLNRLSEFSLHTFHARYSPYLLTSLARTRYRRSYFNKTEAVKVLSMAKSIVLVTSIGGRTGNFLPFFVFLNYVIIQIIYHFLRLL